MEKPSCKLCGQRHWGYENHVGDFARHQRAPNNVTPVTKPQDNVTQAESNVTRRPGRPKVHESAAAKQRAYRARRVQE